MFVVLQCCGNSDDPKSRYTRMSTPCFSRSTRNVSRKRWVLIFSTPLDFQISKDVLSQTALPSCLWFISQSGHPRCLRIVEGVLLGSRGALMMYSAISGRMTGKHRMLCLLLRLYEVAVNFPALNNPLDQIVWLKHQCDGHAEPLYGRTYIRALAVCGFARCDHRVFPLPLASIQFGIASQSSIISVRSNGNVHLPAVRLAAQGSLSGSQQSICVMGDSE